MQIRPLAAPTKFLVRLRIDQYSWHDIVSKSKPQLYCVTWALFVVLIWIDFVYLYGALT